MTITPNMVRGYESYMAVGFRSSLFSSVANDIVVSALTTGKIVVGRLTPVDYFGQALSEEMSDQCMTLDGFLYRNPTAMARVALRNLNVKFVEGIGAWTRVYVRFSPIGEKWWELNKQVPNKGRFSEKQYMEMLLAAWEHRAWSRFERDRAMLLSECVRYIKEG